MILATLQTWRHVRPYYREPAPLPFPPEVGYILAPMGKHNFSVKYFVSQQYTVMVLPFTPARVGPNPLLSHAALDAGDKGAATAVAGGLQRRGDSIGSLDAAERPPEASDSNPGTIYALAVASPSVIASLCDRDVLYTAHC